MIVSVYDYRTIWLGSLGTCLICQKPVALHYWYGAWRLVPRRQAMESQNSDSGHCTRVVPSGRVGPARRNCVAEVLEGAWRLAAREIRQAIWNQVPPSDARGALSGFGCIIGSWGGFLHNFGWVLCCDALAGGLVTSVTCIGITRGHSRL